MKRSLLKSILFLVLCLVGGYLIAGQVNSLLGISFHPKSVPVEPAPSTPQLVPLTEMPPITAVALPPESANDDLYQTAVAVLADVIEFRTGERPLLGEIPAPGRTIHIQTSANLDDPQAFTIQGDGDSVTISGGGRLGAAYGIYHLAGLIRAGLSDEDLFDIALNRAPAMSLRLVTTGAVGVPPLAADYVGGADYSHHSGAFKDVILVDAPYINQENFSRVEEEFKAYVHRMIAYGYNGIVIPGFLEYINFDGLGDGYQIYGPDSPYRPRHIALRHRFGRLFQYAGDMGLSVIMLTDMLALTSPLETYFHDQLGGIDATDPQLWQVYQAGLAELFETWPFVDSLMIRTGEAGHFANLPGWDYYSDLHVTNIEALQEMLASFTSVAATYDKEIIFRTWSVGVGEAGDIHTNPGTYQRVLGDLEMPNLIISTKYAKGDFYSYLDLNPTLQSGGHRRIVEMQARREFEGMGAFPNDVGPLHQTALQALRAGNPNLEGVWTWTQEGGPVRTGPMILYPFFGFWQPTDANVYAAGRLGWDPDADLGAINTTWVRSTFSDHPQTIANLTEMMALSRPAVIEGLYIQPFAQQRVLALGLEPPPMMWLFEWDIVSGSSSVLSVVYFTSQEHVAQAIAGGFNAVGTVRQMQALVAETDPATYHDPALHAQLTESLAYEANLLETLAWHRKTFLHYYEWLATGKQEAYAAWQEAVYQFQGVRREHLRLYGDDLAYPAYDFSAAKIGMAHAGRGRTNSWLARLGLLLIGLLWVGGTEFAQKRVSLGQCQVGLQALWLGLSRPWKLGSLSPRSRWDWFLVSLLPLALIIMARSTFASWLSVTYLILMLGALLLFMAVLLLLNTHQSRFHLWAAVMGASLLKITLLLLVVAVRGPLFYWFHFWTNPAFNTLTITLSVAAAGWLFFVVYVVLRTGYCRSIPAAIGQLLLATGTPLFLLSGLVVLVGLEGALTAFNNEMAILPLGLSKILGITVHLDIPLELPLFTAGAGLVLLFLGGILQLLQRRAVSS